MRTSLPTNRFKYQLSPAQLQVGGPPFCKLSLSSPLSSAANMLSEAQSPLDCLYHCPSKPKDTLSDKKKDIIWKQGSLLHLKDINVNYGVFQIRCQSHVKFLSTAFGMFLVVSTGKKQIRGHLAPGRKVLPTAVLINVKCQNIR